MGSNIARNFARHGYTVALHNRSVAKTDALLAEHGSDGSFVRSETIEEFLAALQRPRRVLIMVKAGDATDAVINELADAMEPGDIIIDGGNALYTDTMRREKAMEYLRWDWHRRNLDPREEPILIAGDFNCSLRNPEFVHEKTVRGLLKEGWISLTQEMPWPQGATVRENRMAKYPPADFDHILLSLGWIKSLGRNAKDVCVYRDKDVPSDHFPLGMKVK
jgi:hypothetical protein